MESGLITVTVRRKPDPALEVRMLDRPLIGQLSPVSSAQWSNLSTDPYIFLGKRDYSAPVNFVSAGIQKKKDEAEEAKADDDASSDEDQGRGRTGFGGGGFGSGRHKAGRVEGEGQIAGMRTQNFSQPQSLGKGFGDWEKHTKGIGAKLLLNMGFQPGKGLGKNLQGRSNIVESYLRKGKGAIGAYGHEGGRPKKDKKLDSDEEEEQDFKEKLNQWRTGNAVAGKKKSVNYVYKSVDDVIAES